MAPKIAAVLTVALALASCATYSDELNRSQRAFEENDHDRTLAFLERLERDYDSLTPEEQTRYAYLRGMTDYRIGYRLEARHWLGVAAASEKMHPGALSTPIVTKVNEALVDLNGKVYDRGFASLTNVRTADTVFLENKGASPGATPSAPGAAPLLLPPALPASPAQAPTIISNPAPAPTPPPQPTAKPGGMVDHL